MTATTEPWCEPLEGSTGYHSFTVLLGDSLLLFENRGVGRFSTSKDTRTSGIRGPSTLSTKNLLVCYRGVVVRLGGMSAKKKII